MIYTYQDTGCYADGAHGHNYVRAKLSELVADIIQPNADGSRSEPTELELEAIGLAAVLQQEMSDDAWEEYRAIELLNDHTVDHTVEWSFRDGDLVLSTVAEFDQ